jgi:NarL family two-component system response regulator YdfI
VIRTLVSASSELARAGLAAIVRGDARRCLVAEAAPADLAQRVAAFSPDVLLEDLGLERAPVTIPNVALVDDPRAAWFGDRLDRADAGPHAILSRDATASEIVAAIVAVAAGLVAVQPHALVTALASDATRPAPDAAIVEPLTARERGVLAELARGVPNKTIAARLGISEHTVKFHVASIFAKLEVSSRTEAVTQGMRLGLVML